MGILDAPILLNSLTNKKFPYLTLGARGDSITFGEVASSPQYNWVNLLAANLGITTVSNTAVSGAQAADQQGFIYQDNVVNNGYQLFTIALGTNDAGYYAGDADKQANFKAILMAESAFLAIPNAKKIFGQASSGVTYSGSWTNTNAYYGTGISKVSNTSGNTATFQVTGSVDNIAYTLLDGNGGTANVSIDGGTAIPINCFGKNGSLILTHHNQAFGSALLRVGGLSNTTHTVVITITSSTSSSNKVIFDWAAGNGSLYPVAGKPTVLHNGVPLRYPSVDVPVYNALSLDVQSTLFADGLPVYWVDILNAINIETQIPGGSDSHPNDAGHHSLYRPNRAVLDSLNSSIKTVLGFNGNAYINGNVTVTGNATVQGIFKTNNIVSACPTGGVAIQCGITFDRPGTSVQLNNQLVTTSLDNYIGVSITPTYNQTGAATATDFLINRTETNVGSGLQTILDLQVNTISRFKVSNKGTVTIGSSSADCQLIVIGSATRIANTTNAGHVFGIGAGTSSYRILQYATTSLAMAANSNGASVIFGSSTMTAATTGTHDILANVAIKGLGAITNGNSRPINNTTALYVGAPSAGGTNNYSLLVDGLSRINAKLIIGSDMINISTAKTPATAGAVGVQGDVAWDASFIYVCTATNTWKRSAITTW